MRMAQNVAVLQSQLAKLEQDSTIFSMGEAGQTLIKEMRQVQNDLLADIQAMHVSATETEQFIKDDLLKQSNLKLEIAAFFGRSNNFFGALRSPCQDTRVYDFIKHLHKLSDKSNQVLSRPIDQIKPARKITEERITRKYSDPKYDNDEYMEQLEQQLVK